MSSALLAYGRLLRARWRWVAWGSILAVAATAVLLIVSPPLYRSEAMVFIRTPGDVSMSRDGGNLFAQSRAETYAALARSTGVASRVVADLGLDLSPQKLSRRIQAKHIGQTALVQVRVGAPSADESRRTAEVLLNELAVEVRILETVPGELLPRAELVVIDPPSRPMRVVAWGAPIFVVLIGALVMGAFLGALGAVVRSLLPRGATPGVAPGNQELEEL